MPIYDYCCEACGFRRDVLQKLSDAPLSTCPECGQAAFKKQVTAAGFQLKGSGWYVTDFREGAKPADKKTTDPSPASSTPAAPAGAAPAKADAAPSVKPSAD